MSGTHKLSLFKYHQPLQINHFKCYVNWKLKNLRNFEILVLKNCDVTCNKSFVGSINVIEHSRYTIQNNNLKEYNNIC